MLTPSLEDYLEEIFNFSLEDEKIRIRDIADKLGVSPPSVVKGLKKLEIEGYIIYEKYKGIKLTELGRLEGKRLVNRNNILREFILMINPDCDQMVEAEACEHYLSPSTIQSFECLCQFFNQNPDALEAYQRFKEKSTRD